MNSNSIKQIATAFKNQFTTLKVTVNKSQLTKFLNETFKDPAVSPDLITHMYERFKPYRLEGDKDEDRIKDV